MKKINIFATIIVVLAFATQTMGQGIWTAKTSFPSGTLIRAGATSAGNKAYVGKGDYGSEFWEYDPITDVWTQKANFGGGSRDWPLCFSIGNKVYMGLGSSGSNMNDLWEYDPLTNAWTQKLSLGQLDSLGMAVQGNLGAVAFSINGKGYVGTGINMAYTKKDFYEFDPIQNSWTTKNLFPGTARYGAVGFSIGNKGYLATGSDGMGTFLTDLWEYEPVTDTWTQKSSFPGSPRHAAVAFTIGTKAYVGSGSTQSSPDCEDDFWCWDQATDTWTPVTTFPGNPRKMSLGFAVNGKGYFGTGFTCPNYAQSDLWEFDPSCFVAAPHICMVTTDSATQFKYNIIRWDKTLYSNVDSFLVYRKNATSPNYFHIGSVDANSPDVFTDTLFSIGGPNGGNPQYSSWFYKLAIRDTCGILSDQSPYHQTMFVQQNNSNFSWNAYTVEAGQTNPVNGYALLRDDNNTGNWQILVTPSGLSATDPGYNNYPDGNWRVDALGFNCASSSKSFYNNQAHSNTTKQVFVEVENSLQNTVTLQFYPNPVKDVIGINVSEKILLEISSLNGQLVLSRSVNAGNHSINVIGLNKGLYILRITSKNGVAVYKMVKE